MRGFPTDLRQVVQRLRRDTADRIEALAPQVWDTASWCDGWLVRDVLGHLVHLAEATNATMGRDMLRHGAVPPDRALAKVARRLGEQPVSDLAQRLRLAAGGIWHVPGSPAVVAAGEVLVHAADMLGPQGLELAAPPSDAGLVIDFYRRISRVVFHSAAPRGVRLVATDLDWQSGKGPVVEGRAMDLLLLIANRRQVIDSLTGPGVASLRR